MGNSYKWDIENPQGSVEARRWHIQSLLQSSQAGVGDIGSVQEADQVQQTHDGDDLEIDLGRQLPVSLGVEAVDTRRDILTAGAIRAIASSGDALGGELLVQGPGLAEHGLFE